MTLRVGRVYRGEVEAEGGQDARREVLDDDISVPGEAEEDISTCHGLQVEGNGLFVRIEVEEEPGLLGARLIVEERRHAPRRIAAIRALNLDDFGTVVGQELRRVRAGDVMRQVEDLDALQRSSWASAVQPLLLQRAHTT